MKTKLIFAGIIALALQSNAQWSPTGTGQMWTTNTVRIGGSSTTINQTMHIGDGSGALHYGSNGVLIKFAPGTTDRALFELEDPSGQNKTVFQSLSYATFLSAAVNKPLYLQTGGGRVGINTTSPIAMLHVAGASNCAIVAASGDSKATVWAAGNIASFGLQADGSVGRIVNNINGPQTTIFSFAPSNNGQVWIGTKPTTLHTDFKLAIGGKLVAQSVYVTLQGNWADYVFAPEYKLPKLSDVESYYKTNRHLPEIPSAAEVEENGIDVAQINTLLLKKVEELTLYMVDLNKKVEVLAAENAKLKEQSGK